MATVNFLYRSTKNEAPLNIRLLFRHQDEDFVLGARTGFWVTKHYWAKQHNLKRVKDVDLINKQNEVRNELNSIESYVLNTFRKADPNYVKGDWLKRQMEIYYNPSKRAEALPKDLVNYIDSYLISKGNDISKNTIKKCNVIKQLVLRFCHSRKKDLLISEIDQQFKNEFEAYCLSQNYSHNTIVVAFKFIKTICNHAKIKGIETSPELPLVKAKYLKTKRIFLTFEDLAAIESTSDLPEYLENARDWLIISCYLGQRVSDFMRFDKSMIRYEENKNAVIKSLIEFKQQKTGKLMTVPVHNKVIQILEKRDGEFPRAISDQKYNAFIKDVCRFAGLTDSVEGSKKVETKKGSGIYRKSSGTFEKWELVTSHIGRRSFATNFYSAIPTTLLINVTGHSSEAQFLEYIGKSNKDLAMELTNYF